jgi:type IV pilus assembly protein PilN
VIRINLLTAKPTPNVSRLPTVHFDGQKLTLACALILVAGAGLIGWRYWQIQAEATELKIQVSLAEIETIQLRAILVQVQQFEQRRTELQQRVGLIESLRQDQTGPVHMLDEISKAMPPALWLTDLKQSVTGGEVVIDGRCTALTGLTDFVTSLERSGYFKRSVEIVNTELETSPTAADLIRFSIKADLNRPAVAAANSAGAMKPAN